MRLRWQLTLGALGAALLPLGLLAGWTEQVASSRARQGLEREQAALAQAHAAFVERWVEDQQEFLEGWTTVYAGRISDLNEAMLVGFLRSIYLSMGSARVVALLDETGQPVVPPVVDPEAPDLTRRVSPEHARALLQDLQAKTSVYGLEFAGGPGVVLRAPLPTGAGTRWEVVVELASERLASNLREGSDDGRAVALMDELGQTFLGAEHPLLRPDLLATLAGNVFHASYPLADGTRVVGAAVRVDDPPWTVVVVERQDLAFRVVREQRLALLSAVVGAASLALFAAAAQAAALARPLNRLESAVGAVRGGVLGQTATVEGPWEVRRLASAFNEMSKAILDKDHELREQQAEIESFNRELQSRVEERTRDLVATQEELVRRSELAAVAELGAGLAHELNNPLAAVLGLAQVLRAREPAGTTGRLLQDLEQEAQRCREVVSAMVRVSEPAAEGAEGGCTLPGLFQDLEGLLVSLARSRGLGVQVGPPPDATLAVGAGAALRVVSEVAHCVWAGLAAGGQLRVDGQLTANEALLTVLAQGELAPETTWRDDRRAQGLRVWVARRLAVELGGRVEPPDRPEDPWTIAFPLAPSR